MLAALLQSPSLSSIILAVVIMDALALDDPRDLVFDSSFSILFCLGLAGRNRVEAKSLSECCCDLPCFLEVPFLTFFGFSMEAPNGGNASGEVPSGGKSSCVLGTEFPCGSCIVSHE